MTRVPDRHSLCLSPYHRYRPAHPFSDSQSKPNPCQTFSMKNLIDTICLTLAVLIGNVGVSWGAGEFPNFLDGLCLDNVEEGCMPRFLPLKGHNISYCEASCDLINPVKMRGMDGVLYDLSCRADVGVGEYPDRVMLLKQNPKDGKGSLMLWIDSADIFKIVRCPTP